MAESRVLFISLEFSSGTFSGNGVAAQSQAGALASVGTHVLVLAASPHAQTVLLHPCQPAQGDGDAVQPGSLQLIEVPVSTWGRLSPAAAPLDEFTAGLSSPQVVEAVAAFAPQVALVVDGSGLPAWQALRRRLPAPPPPYVWLCFRVFARTEEGQDLEFVRALEAEAMAGAAATIALSRSDRQFLLDSVWPFHQRPRNGFSTAHLPTASNHDQQGNHHHPHAAPEEDDGSASLGSPPQPQVHVLLPALRGDMKHLPLPRDVVDGGGDGEGLVGGAEDDGAWPSGTCAAAAEAEGGSGEGQCGAGTRQRRRRRYLSCVVRLAREKEPHLFVELVEALGARGALRRAGLVPLMVGAASDAYAQEVKARLLRAAPDAVLVEQFQGPEQLAQLYASTRLNVHPATYDAYGMTIVEAASQGCPSLVHDAGDGAVGATDLLRGAEREVLLVDLKQGMGAVAAHVEELLLEEGGATLDEVARRAAARARSWDEPTHARELLSIIKKASAA